MNKSNEKELMYLKPYSELIKNNNLKNWFDFLWDAITERKPKNFIYMRNAILQCEKELVETQKILKDLETFYFSNNDYVKDLSAHQLYLHKENMNKELQYYQFIVMCIWENLDRLKTDFIINYDTNLLRLKDKENKKKNVNLKNRKTRRNKKSIKKKNKNLLRKKTKNQKKYYRKKFKILTW